MFGAISGLVGGAIGLYQGKKASDAAKDAGKKQAKVSKRVTEEELRQLERDRQQTIGAFRAKAGASGASMRSPSFSTVEQDLEREFDMTRNYTSEVGADRARAQIDASKSFAKQALWSGIGSAVESFGDAGESWLKYRGIK